MCRYQILCVLSSWSVSGFVFFFWFFLTGRGQKAILAPFLSGQCCWRKRGGDRQQLCNRVPRPRSGAQAGGICSQRVPFQPSLEPARQSAAKATLRHLGLCSPGTLGSSEPLLAQCCTLACSSLLDYYICILKLKLNPFKIHVYLMSCDCIILEFLCQELHTFCYFLSVGYSETGTFTEIE